MVKTRPTLSPTHRWIQTSVWCTRRLTSEPPRHADAGTPWAHDVADVFRRGCTRFQQNGRRGIEDVCHEREDACTGEGVACLRVDERVGVDLPAWFVGHARVVRVGVA